MAENVLRILNDHFAQTGQGNASLTEIARRVRQASLSAIEEQKGRDRAIEQRLSEYYHFKAKNFSCAGAYGEAMDCWQKLLTADPGNKAVHGALRRIRTRIEQQGAKVPDRSI
jgi:hypothetical protein